MRKVLFILLCLSSAYVWAAMQIQTIALQGRSAEEIIPILQPMLVPGASLSGTGYKLIIRSTPENIEQIRALLADIDTAPAQLIISVSDDLAVLADSQQQSARITITDSDKSASATLGKPAERTQPDGQFGAQLKNGRVDVEGSASTRYQTRREPIVQQVRATEGLWASIRFGQAIPYATRSVNPDGTVTETIHYEPVTSGFQVMPRLNGDRVTLTIKPQRQSIAAQAGGAYNLSRVETTLQVQLGEWVEIGSIAQSTTSSSQGIGYGQQSRGGDLQRVFVKIERVPQ